MGYDVIVIGSGAAGAVIGRRLADATDASILVIEAGGRDANPAIHDPTRVHELWLSDDDWAYFTEPQEHCDGRRLHWPRGKVVGGSSALNGMMWFRSWHGDYDFWCYLGNQGWSYDDVLPLFKRAEDFDGGASAYRGAGGPLRVMADYERHPVSEAFVEAAQLLGIPYNADFNGPELAGVGFAQYHIRDGRRDTAAGAFLAPALERGNVTLWTDTLVQRLVFDGTRCVGVEVARDGRTVLVDAAREVIVCAGAIESPKLLMLSGIGPAAHLRDHGVDVLVDLPGVGENLHDHTLVPTIHAGAREIPAPFEGTTAHCGNLFWYSREGLVAPDLQPLLFHVPLYEEWMSGPENAFTLLAGHIRPASRGTIRLASTDPAAHPLIDPRYLSCESDVDALLASVKLCREIVSTSPLAAWVESEVYPGADVRSDDDLRDYIRRTVVTYHHQVGTCKMGVDAQSVVDAELRVRGTTGLRVADASIMPLVTSGNTVAPTVMIGERASDLVAAALGAVAATA